MKPPEYMCEESDYMLAHFKGQQNKYQWPIFLGRTFSHVVECDRNRLTTDSGIALREFLQNMTLTETIFSVNLEQKKSPTSNRAYLGLATKDLSWTDSINIARSLLLTQGFFYA